MSIGLHKILSIGLLIHIRSYSCVWIHIFSVNSSGLVSQVGTLTPVNYSSVAISYPSVISTKPMQRANIRLQDPHFKVVISENGLGHYDWQLYFELPSAGQGVLIFGVETTTDVHVAISPEPETVNPMYEIVIGGCNNSESVIRRASQSEELLRNRYPSPIAEGLNDFWVSIDASTRLIKVGFGRNPKLESSILMWGKDPNFLSGARYIAFTNWNAPVTYSNISLETI